MYRLIGFAACALALAACDSAVISGVDCGNDALDGAEVCDGTALGTETCVSLGLGAGSIACAADCTYDTSGCTGSVGGGCGDDVIDAGEDCEVGQLGGENCATLGLTSGALVCASDCSFDVGGCTGAASCGNDTREFPEECDGADLAGADCTDVGLSGGTLGCRTDCAFDTSACDQSAVCGDDLVAGAEDCDGTNLGGESCTSLGLGTGTLACASCAFDTTACTGGSSCGNDTREFPESCDGADLAGEDCLSRGFASGTLDCAGDCSFDESGCSPCGNGQLDGSEACDDGGVATGDGCDDTCTVEAGWSCAGVPSVCLECDDPDTDGYGVGPDCLGLDCDETRTDINEGATETCNGDDDNCDGTTDESSDVGCYTGPGGTDGVGRCQAGTSYCVGGTLGPCVGEVIPGAEACNLQDDDCNGSDDDGLPDLNCGAGICATTVASCDGAGNLQQCVPGPPGAEQGNCADGLDNDCNGLVDDCTCVHVASFGDNTTGDGTEGLPLQTVAAGIALAQQGGQPPVVCLGADNNGTCTWTFYAEDVRMADGIAISGGWDTGQSPWVQRSLHGANQNCVTEIQGQTQNVAAVTFDVTAVNTTALDNVVVSLQNPGADATTVLVEGSLGALIQESSVFGAGGGTTSFGIQITDDPLSGTAATPMITRTSVNGGAALTGAAIHSVRSSPVIQSNCGAGRILPNGRCLQGCISDIAIRANRFTGGGAQLSDDAAAIVLEDSPGAVVDQSVICGSGNTTVDGVRILGDATGTVISRNDIVVWGADADNGIHAANCGGAAPWIFDNERIAAEGNAAGTGIAAATRAMGDCHPLIEGNELLVGGVEGSVLETYGVHCSADPNSGVASKCSIVDNVEIRGCNSNFPNIAVGVRCEAGSCNVISGNGLIWGRSGIDVAGLQLVGPTSAFVDGNVIMGGCGTTTSIGVLAHDAAARLQNNVIDAGTCQPGGIPSTDWYGVRAVLEDGVNELDLHSNTVLAGGVAASGCTGRGLSLEVDPLGVAPTLGLGVVRNNIFDAGVCATNYAVVENDPSTDPRVFENNDLWPGGATALYRDEASTDLSAAIDVDNLTDMQVGQTLDVDPQWTLDATNGLYRLDPASLCRDAGSAIGAPTADFEGEARPEGAGNDIGADEVY